MNKILQVIAIVIILMFKISSPFLIDQKHEQIQELKGKPLNILFYEIINLYN